MKLLTILFVLSVVMLTIPISINAQPDASAATLRRLADDYYNWRNQNYPVNSSDAGLHTWDNKLTDYGLSALLARRLQSREETTIVAAQAKYIIREGCWSFRGDRSAYGFSFAA